MCLYVRKTIPEKPQHASNWANSRITPPPCRGNNSIIIAVFFQQSGVASKFSVSMVTLDPNYILLNSRSTTALFFWGVGGGEPKLQMYHHDKTLAHKTHAGNG